VAELLIAAGANPDTQNKVKMIVAIGILKQGKAISYI